MKAFIEKITNWIKENRTLSIWIFAISTMVIIFIYSLISNIVDPTTTDLIDIPLPTGTELEISIPKSTYEDLDLKNKPTKDIYYVQEVDQSGQIEIFLARIGKTNLSKEKSAELLTIWSDTDDLFQYSQNESEIFFRFSDPVAIPDVDFGYINSKNGADALAQVARAITGEIYTYTNVKVGEEGGTFRIEANREVDGVRIERPGISEYSDYLIVDDAGQIVEGRLFLPVFSDVSLRVKIIHPTNLAGIVGKEVYPKEVNQGYARSITEEDYQDASTTVDSSLNDVTLESLEFPKATDITVEELELVYFFSNHNYPEIFPIYKIQGTGTVTFKGKEYVVPVLIYASALDPDLVYIPSEVDEPTPEL